MSEFQSAGMNATFTPDPSTPLLSDFQIVYNLANWTGNTTAYMRCDLPGRASEYVGNCSAMPVSCAVNIGGAGQPYNCTDLASGNALQGNLSR